MQPLGTKAQPLRGCIFGVNREDWFPESVTLLTLCWLFILHPQIRFGPGVKIRRDKPSCGRAAVQDEKCRHVADFNIAAHLKAAVKCKKRFLCSLFFFLLCALAKTCGFLVINIAGLHTSVNEPLCFFGMCRCQKH